MTRRILRGYQQRLKQGMYEAWDRGARTVIGELATGGGKTVVKADMAFDLGGRGIIQAHRSELVGQISTALGAQGLRHNIIAADKTIRQIVERHCKKLGGSFYDPRASWSVASTPTIVKNGIPNAHLIDWHFVDEGHHVLRENTWGRAVGMTPKARVALFTATPGRADGKGLGRDADGIADVLVRGAGLGELIGDGNLCPYQVASCRASDLDLSDVAQGADGDYVKTQLSKAVKRSNKIVGDIVDNYRKHAEGKQAIVFAVDIEHAGVITSKFVERGIKAELVHGDMEGDRGAAMKRFESRETNVLVNVDLFGEGLDVPGIEVVIMARPTQSFPLFCQMVGRMLRLVITELQTALWDTFDVATRKAIIATSPKPFGLLIDHVGNIYQQWKVGPLTFGGPHAPVLPEGFTAWEAGMLRRNKRASKPADGIPTRRCMGWDDHKGCAQEYERTLDACPYCNCPAPPPATRSTPREVDGDVFLLSPEVLARMRGEADRVIGQCFVPAGLTPIARKGIENRHTERVLAQQRLRVAMDAWADKLAGRSLAEKQKTFFFTYGIDTLTALALGSTDADALRAKLEVQGHAAV